MNEFTKGLFRDNPILGAYLGIGPILLMSNRLIYAVVFSGFYLAYFSLMALIIWLIERYMHKSLHFTAKLLMAAVFIALGDLIITATVPLIRADMGILLPLTLAATPMYIALFPGQERSSSPVATLYGRLLGFLAVFLLIAAVREFLAFGGLDLNISPWRASSNQAGPFMIFSSGFGLLFLIAYCRALFSKAVS